jgi:hypothetical protein
VIRRLATLARDDGERVSRVSLVAIQTVTTEWGISEAELDAVEFVAVPTVHPPPTLRR